MRFCCEAFAKEARRHSAFAGGGAEMQSTGQIEQAEDGTWNVNGCCGGGCYVLIGIKHCPFCGASLQRLNAMEEKQPDIPASEKSEVTPEMIAAGMKELWDSGWFEHASPSDGVLVTRVFLAMTRSRSGGSK